MKAKGGKKKGKTIIATDAPNKKEIEQNTILIEEKKKWQRLEKLFFQ